MRDVSCLLLPDDGIVSLDSQRRVLEAAERIHDAFRGENLSALCPLEARFTAMSPAKRDAWEDRPIGHLFLRGWDAFHDLLPSAVANAVEAVYRDPKWLADELRARDTTLLHGDIRLHNVALDADRTWQLAALGTLAMLGWNKALDAVAQPRQDRASPRAAGAAVVDRSVEHGHGCGGGYSGHSNKVHAEGTR